RCRWHYNQEKPVGFASADRLLQPVPGKIIGPLKRTLQECSQKSRTKERLVLSTNDDRIAQFRKMAEDDPNNELGHFSLGRALLDAGQHQEAAQSFQRVLALNPNIGKAYQLLADAQLKTGHRDLAIETLKNGINTSHKRGDL